MLKNISLESRMLSLVGSLLYGKPSIHGLPDDFFYLPEDRDISGNPKVNVHANLTRAKLIRAERWMARAIGLGMLVLWISVIAPLGIKSF